MFTLLKYGYKSNDRSKHNLKHNYKPYGKYYNRT